MLRRELADRDGIADSLEDLAAVAASLGRSQRAARLSGSAEALREAIDAPIPPSRRADYERNVVETRAALGQEAFAAAWAEGRAMSLEQALAYALGEPTSS